MKTIACYNLGRFGNRLFRAAKALALAEQTGAELRMEPWEGERIFTLDGCRPKRPDGTEDLVIDGYCQNQQSLIYSRADCRRWFALRPEIEEALIASVKIEKCPHAHLRKGDYISCGYPVLSMKAVIRAMRERGMAEYFVPVSDEFPLVHDGATMIGLSFLPDFYRLTRAPVLFRANSSFSWWAATLSHGKVFSPVITGLAGGVEHDNVPFVEGNWPRLCELDFVTDLHLKEQ